MNLRWSKHSNTIVTIINKSISQRKKPINALIAKMTKTKNTSTHDKKYKTIKTTKENYNRNN